MVRMVNEVSVLEREVYSEAEAARLLGISQGTLHYWLEGGERRGRTYMPVIRREPRGRRAAVTWGEFVEAGFLRSYRKSNIPMEQLRQFITTLRDELDTPYPLASQRPWVSRGAGLVMAAQEQAGLPKTYWLFLSGQILTPWGADFVDRVTWSDESAESYRPHNDLRSPVVVNPSIRFGRPSIGGVSTRAIFEESEAGTPVAELAKIYQLKITDVRWALAYEGTKAA